MILKNEFDNILNTYGHYVLLVHRKDNLRCSCYNEKTQSASRKCAFCFGLGFTPVITREITRDIDNSVPMTLPLITQSNLYGNVAVGTRAYFFKSNVNVREGDLIIDVEWADKIPRYTGGGVFEVAHIDPNRFESGEIIFKKVYVKDQPINKSIRGFQIVEQSGITFYRMAEEKGE